MNDGAFDPTDDATRNYFHALAMMRLRAVLTGERFATEHDTFDLVMAAALMRGKGSAQINLLAKGLR